MAGCPAPAERRAALRRGHREDRRHAGLPGGGAVPGESRPFRRRVPRSRPTPPAGGHVPADFAPVAAAQCHLGS